MAGTGTTRGASGMPEFSQATREWFASAFPGPTAAQLGAWEAIANGDNALVIAPTGSGKTLSAFLWAIDRLRSEPVPPERNRRCRILYVSPLKALAADVQRNLRAPLIGINHAAHRLGEPPHDITIGMRTGDTPASERRSFAKKPPDILVTTPESLFLILTSAAREGLAGVETVIVDEVHALAGTKRGAHLAVSLERLDAYLVAEGGRPAQRIGLSATVEPPAEVARFLSGARPPSEGGRETRIVAPTSTKQWQIDLVVPVPDLTDLTMAAPSSFVPPVIDQLDLAGPATAPERKASVWPHVQERITDYVSEHKSTLVFTNSRRGAERLTTRLNEIWAQRNGFGEPDPGGEWAAQMPGQSGTAAAADAEAPIIARTHHGSMSRTERLRTETELKAGTLPAVVATSSLELGIDMGDVDLVVQVGAPPSVASGLQRIGRAGHQVGAVSHGVVFPTHRGDLLPATVIASRMRAGLLEPLAAPRSPLDVLAQQVVAALAMDEWHAPELLAVMRRAYPYSELGDAAWRAVLDMLAGRYPSSDFGDLRPRITWDRGTDVLAGRPGALRLAATSGGTIPDRGLYPVILAGSDAEGQRGGKRVGELDEEMVFESRVGDTFTLGSSTWRIEEITPNQVNVTPAPGLPGRLPFWRGDQPARPVPLGLAIGEFVRTLDDALVRDESRGRQILADAGLDQWAADNLVSLIAEQRGATGRLPDDRTVVVERFRDELGEWRVVIHNPLGKRVNAPWALIIAARLQGRLGVDVSAVPSDDGIVLRLPDTDWGVDPVFLNNDDDAASGFGRAAAAPAFGVGADDLLVDADEVAALVRDQLGGSVLFATRFREAAARALLLPRRSPTRRQPLWQQRLRASQLLQVASVYPEFPIVLEAAREVLQEDFDIVALAAFQRRLADGQVRLVEVTTEKPSPFAQDVMFGYTAEFLYNGDSPLAERRVAALTLDQDLLNELLGASDSLTVAELLDEKAVLAVEAELGRLAVGRQARDPEGVWDLLHALGPLSLAEIAGRVVPDADSDALVDALVAARRVIAVRIAGEQRFAIVEDAGRLRDGLGVALPVGIPEDFTAPVADPLGDLLRRHLRTSGPLGVEALAGRFGLGVALVREVLGRLTDSGALVAGALRPTSLGGTGEEWADPEVLRRLRRRSLAALRREVEPVDQPSLGAFLPHWQQVGRFSIAKGDDGLLLAVEQLAGYPVPASALETLILPARISDYRPELLADALARGEVLWAGHGRLPGSGGGDGLVSLHLAADSPWTLPQPGGVSELWPDAETLAPRVLELLAGSGGYFLPQLAARLDASQSATLDALWELVWAGFVTNDAASTLREAVARGVGGAHRAPRQSARARPLRAGRFSGLRPAASASALIPGGGGRWSLLPPVESDLTRRAHAMAQVLMDRHGVLVKAVAATEGLTGDGMTFAQVYRVLKELEDRGKVRRGYFVEGLGGSQFALPGAVDLLRSDAAARERLAENPGDKGGSELAKSSVLLAATDPANPYGAALPWPAERDAGHKPGRKPGAVVVLVNGDLALFVERGGRSLLTFGPPDILAPAISQLASAAGEGRLGRLVITRINGEPALDAVKMKSLVAEALVTAGFAVTPSGLRLR